MDKPFRCFNPCCATHPSGRLGFDFWAEHPVCPKCKVDGRQVRYAQVVVELCVIHLDPPGGQVEGIGRNTPACNPNVRIGGAWLGTADPNAVNCPACKETEEYRDATETAQPVLKHLREWAEQRKRRQEERPAEQKVEE